MTRFTMRDRMEQEGKSEVEILRAELDACFEIIESLPVDPHDMDVHFWCEFQCWGEGDIEEETTA